LTLDCTVNHLEEGPLRTILYADDIALAADSREELEEKVQLWQGALAGNSLRLNVRKTKFISSEQRTEAILDCQGEVIEKVEQFRYLGSDLSEERSVDQAVKGRISAAWLKWRECTGILCDHRCSRTLKGKLYGAVVRPALIYGCECWALGRAQALQLHAEEMDPPGQSAKRGC
uniref:Reverse transcriptase domain-containing protein n=1 Tax=Heligmosomoides polygyrus TaxID=6339 RepID=A0A183GSZ2_HELPZ